MTHKGGGGGYCPVISTRFPYTKFYKYEIQISRAGKKKFLCAKNGPIQKKMCLNENFKIEARLGRVHAPHDGDVSRAGAQRKKKRLFFLFSPVSPGYAPAM